MRPHEFEELRVHCPDGIDNIPPILGTLSLTSHERVCLTATREKNCKGVKENITESIAGNNRQDHMGRVQMFVIYDLLRANSLGFCSNVASCVRIGGRGWKTAA